MGVLYRLIVEFYGSESPLAILFVTVVLGGGAAWLAGRAIAQTWRPLWHVAGYIVLLGAAVRFIQFALFEAPLLAPLAYAADTLFLLVVGCLAWRLTRVTQMVTQYAWLYERAGPFAWRARGATNGGSKGAISG